MSDEKKSVEKMCYSIPEAAQAVGISVRSVYRLVSAGDFPIARLRGRTVVPVKSLEAWVMKRLDSTK